jgi:hypothetical protein
MDTLLCVQLIVYISFLNTASYEPNVLEEGVVCHRWHDPWQLRIYRYSGGTEGATGEV